MKAILIKIPTNSNVSKEKEIIKNKIESMGGKKNYNKWQMKLEVHIANKLRRKDLRKKAVIFSSTSYPEKSALICDQSTNIIETSSEFKTLALEKLQVYDPKPRIRLLILDGEEYTIGDFKVRFGEVSNSHDKSKIESIVLEIEYTPCKLLARCESMLTEFLNMIHPGKHYELKMNMVKFNLEAEFSMRHHASLYNSLIDVVFDPMNKRKKVNQGDTGGPIMKKVKR